MMRNMTFWNRLFRDHPASVDETYWQHFANAVGFGLRMIWGGIICLVHAVIPGAFCTKGSDMICELHERMLINRRRLAELRVASLGTRKAA